MANIYVNSVDGSDSDDGSTWALAKATIVGAAAIDNAGDTIYVSDNSAETGTASISITFNGTDVSPVRIICADDSAEPPTTVATSGTVTTTAAGNMTFTTGALYVYGLSFICGTSSGNNVIVVSNGAGHSVWENCSFQIAATGAAGRIQFANNNGSNVELNNCTVKFGATGQGIGGNGYFIWRGGSILSGSSAVTSIFNNNFTAGSRFDVQAVDFSNGATAMSLTNSTGANIRGVFADCKLPASWSGQLAAAIAQGARYEMYNCDAGDTNYRIWIEDYAGEVTSETTIVRSGGASDGTTPLAWEMATTANSDFELNVMRSGEIVKWNESTGSGVTVTVEIAHNAVGGGTAGALTDREIWLEVMYLGTSGFPLGTMISDRAATVLTTAADQASSSETWGGAGSGYTKQKVSVTFTPAEKGYIHAQVCMALPSVTCFIDPLLTVS